MKTDNTKRTEENTQRAESDSMQRLVSSKEIIQELHAILDEDDSKIIRNHKDGYPERPPHEMTIQERVTALCKYAADWKHWCIEKG